MTYQKQAHNALKIDKRENSCKYCCAKHPSRHYLADGKKCGRCGKQNYFKAVCKLIWKQEQDWCGRTKIYDVGQNDDLHVAEQDRSLDVVWIKNINLHSIKCVIFTEHTK